MTYMYIHLAHMIIEHVPSDYVIMGDDSIVNVTMLERIT